MKKEIIKTDNYLLVVDDSAINFDDWVYNKWGSLFQYGIEHRLHPSTKKVIAHLPFGMYSTLEGVPLLPPLEQEDKELYYQKQVMQPYSVESQSYMSYENGFIDGYNKAKETYKFTEEDAKYLFECGRNFQINADITFTVARKHLLQPKSPTYFEFETEITHEGNGTYSTDLMDIGLSNLTPIKVIKTTTNSQGQQVAYGKYIY